MSLLLGSPALNLSKKIIWSYYVPTVTCTYPTVAFTTLYCIFWFNYLYLLTYYLLLSTVYSRLE